MMLVRQMIGRTGKPVKNQFIVTVGNTVYFQSYKSTIAKVKNDNLTLGKHFDYSATTSKYLHQFLLEHCYKFARMNKKELQEQIDNGNIKYIDKQNWL